jgi:hypothetical protein
MRFIHKTDVKWRMKNSLMDSTVVNAKKNVAELKTLNIER